MSHKGKKRRLNGLNTNSGVAGFYDEMIVFFVVLISVFIFFGTILQTWDSYGQRRDIVGNYESTWELLNNIHHSDLLTHEGEAGLFEGNKIKAINLDNFTRHFNNSISSIYFELEIIDLSNSTTIFETNLTNHDSLGPEINIMAYRHVLTKPIAIWINDENIHPGQLRLEVWK